MFDIGILGGMGPKACSILFDFIVEHTIASKDQDHPSILILDDTKIPDRSSFLINPNSNVPNPAPFLEKDLQQLKSNGVKVAGISCNTSYCFFDRISIPQGIQIIHMPNITMSYCKAVGYKKVLILSTKGSKNSKVFESRAFNSNDIIYPQAKELERIHNLIYKIKDTANLNINILSKQLSLLINKITKQITDDVAIVLGCTELSILNYLKRIKASSPIIDPLEILGLCLIKKSGYLYSLKDCKYNKDVIDKL